MNPRLAYLRERYGDLLLNAFRADERNRPFSGLVMRRSREEAADTLFERYCAADPTPNGTYTQWLLRQAVAGLLPVEDLEKAKETLDAFQTYKRRIAADARDIGRYDDLASVWTVIEPFVASNAATSGKDEERRLRESVRAESTIIMERNDWTVVIPQTVRASQWWGRGTRWCTASSKAPMFTSYNRSGPLVIFVRPDGKKFQFHAPGQQFMNDADKAVKPNTALAGIERVLSSEYPALAAALWPENRNLVKHLPDAITEYALSITTIPERKLTRDICLAYVRRNQTATALGKVPEQFRDAELCRVAVEGAGGALRHVPHALIDRDLCLEAVRRSGSALGHVPRELIDEEMCRTAVSHSGIALTHVPAEFSTRTLHQAAVLQDGEALQFVPEPLRTPDLCEDAVRQSGWAIKHVPPILRNRAMCLEAVGKAGVLGEVPARLRDMEICRLAVECDPLTLGDVPETILDEAMCLSAVERYGSALRFVPRKRITLEMCRLAIRHDGNGWTGWQWVPQRFAERLRELQQNDVAPAMDALDVAGMHP